MQLCLTKLSVILEIDPYELSLDFFFQWKNYRSMLQIFKACQQRMILYYRKKKKSEFALILNIRIEMYNGYFLFWLSTYWTKNMIFLHNDGLSRH